MLQSLAHILSPTMANLFGSFILFHFIYKRNFGEKSLIYCNWFRPSVHSFFRPSVLLVMQTSPSCYDRGRSYLIQCLPMVNVSYHRCDIGVKGQGHIFFILSYRSQLFHLLSEGVHILAR